MLTAALLLLAALACPLACFLPLVLFKPRAAATSVAIPAAERRQDGTAGQVETAVQQDAPVTASSPPVRVRRRCC